MRKCAVFLLVLFLFCLPVCSHAAERVECPSAGFSFLLPDRFTVTDLSDSEDPDLCMMVESKNMSVYVFVSYVGKIDPDSIPFVLTGDETDMGGRRIAGRKVQYIAGSSDGASYYSCFWVKGKDGVTLDFIYTGKSSKAMPVIERILDSIEWND